MIDALQARVLVELLLKLFSPEELLSFLIGLPNAGDIAHHIPSRHVEPRWMFQAAVEALDRRRLLEDDAFFDALVDIRSRHKDSIELARGLLVPTAQPPTAQPSDKQQALAEIERARGQMRHHSPKERWEGWKSLTRALTTLQRHGALDDSLQSQLSTMLSSIQQLTSTLAGARLSDEDLDAMSHEALKARFRQQEGANRAVRAVASITPRVVFGKPLKKAVLDWRRAYTQQHAIPLPESAEVLVSGLSRWFWIQLAQGFIALIGALVFGTQLYLLHLDVQVQERQLNAEQQESQAFRRTSLYATLYADEPCPNDSSARCPSFNRRSRQDAAHALLQIEDRTQELDWAGAYLSDVLLERGTDLTRIVFDSTILSGAELIKADLSETSCVGAHFHDATLHSARFPGATLDHAQFQRASLIEADLTGARAIEASFEDANLSGAVLTGADLTGADLSGADLIGAELTGAILRDTRYSDETTWPEGFQPRNVETLLLTPSEE